MGNLSHYPVCFFPYCSGSPAFLSSFPSQPLAMGVSLEWILFQASAQQSGNMFWTLTSGRYSVYLYTCTLENKMYLMNVGLLQTLLSPRKAEAKCRALEFLKEQPGLCALCSADRPRLGQRQARGATLREAVRSPRRPVQVAKCARRRRRNDVDRNIRHARLALRRDRYADIEPVGDGFCGREYQHVPAR